MVANVRRGLDHAAVPLYLQHALLNPLCACVGIVCYDGIGVLEVEWDKCFRTGGPVGPTAFQSHRCRYVESYDSSMGDVRIRLSY
eukprot:4260869-Pyramimonas_sp.AAC.1